MGESARVSSVEALRGFVPALVEFRDQTQAALVTAEATASRLVDWIRRDRLPHWKREIQRRQELVTRARSYLESKRPLDADEARPNVDARLALEKAKRSLREAEAKLAATQRWAALLDREVAKFRSAIAPMAWFARADLPKALAALERMGTALDEYLAQGQPDAGPTPVDLEPPEAPPADAEGP